MKGNKENSRTALDVISQPKHKIPTCVCRRLHLSENVFCQGMVAVLLNPVYVLLSGMFHVYINNVSVVVSET